MGVTGTRKAIRDILVECARKRATITYSELGEKVGRPAQGPWRDDLDPICQEEQKAGRPDVTLVVVKKNKSYPTIYMGEILDPNDKEIMSSYRKDLEFVWDFWKEDSRIVTTPRSTLEFMREAHRQSLIVASSPHESEDQDFVEAITDWSDE